MRASRLPDQTGLPIFTTGTKSLGWLGLLFLMAVLGWCVGTLLYTYFHLRLYSIEWPQDDLPLPALVSPAFLFCALLLAAAASGAGWAAQRHSSKSLVMFCLVVACLLQLVFLALHVQAQTALPFAPQTNAYGSIFYLLSWALDVLVIIGVGLAAAAVVRLWQEREHWRLFTTLHVQMSAHYSYFTAAMGMVIYAALYVSPHVL
jgi:hypothetical protein